MKKHVSIVSPLASILVLPLLAVGAPAAYAAQNGGQPYSEAMEAARAKLAGGGSFAEKVVRAQARSGEVEAMARERAATFARSAAGQSAAQLRTRLPGNAQMANAAGKPCDDPATNPPADTSALCKPGEH